MSIIYVGWVAVIVLAILGFAGAAEDIVRERRGRHDGQRRH
jgi:hypothetical protein